MLDLNNKNEKVIHSNFDRYIIVDLVTKEYCVLQPKQVKNMFEEHMNEGKKLIQRENIINDDSTFEVSPVIITGFDCNYTCDYCYQRCFNKPCEKMKESDLSKIFDFYKEFDKVYKTNTIIKELVIAGGEPFLTNNYDFIKAVFSRKEALKIAFISNGAEIILFHDLLEKNKDRISEIMLSIDGDKELHFRHRKTLNEKYYDNVWETLEFLLQIGVKVSISTVFQENSVKDYVNFFDLLDKFGWSENKFSVSFNMDVNRINDDDYINRIKDSFNDLCRIDIRAKRLFQDIMNYAEYNILKMVYNNKNYKPYKSCEITYKPSFVFLPDGKILPCIKGLKYDIVVGTFKPKITIDKLLVDRIFNRDVRKITQCSDCQAKFFCCGGCIVDAIGKEETDDKVCGRWLENDFSKSLESALDSLIINHLSE